MGRGSQAPRVPDSVNVATSSSGNTLVQGVKGKYGIPHWGDVPVLRSIWLSGKPNVGSRDIRHLDKATVLIYGRESVRALSVLSLESLNN